MPQVWLKFGLGFVTGLGTSFGRRLGNRFGRGGGGRVNGSSWLAGDKDKVGGLDVTTLGSDMRATGHSDEFSQSPCTYT